MPAAVFRLEGGSHTTKIHTPVRCALQAWARSPLALEPCESFRIGGQQLREDFESDVATELGVPGPIHFDHATSPEWADDLIGIQSRTTRERHGEYRDYTRLNLEPWNVEPGTRNQEPRFP
jgi:hypothetical protein